MLRTRCTSYLHFYNFASRCCANDFVIELWSCRFSDCRVNGISRQLWLRFEISRQSLPTSFRHILFHSGNVRRRWCSTIPSHSIIHHGNIQVTRGARVRDIISSINYIGKYPSTACFSVCESYIEKTLMNFGRHVENRYVAIKNWFFVKRSARARALPHTWKKTARARKTAAKETRHLSGVKSSRRW